MAISVTNLTKHYQVHIRPPGFAGALRSLLRREYRTVRAVDGITFQVEPGEVVGFLGPNGAGKTTTLKMLAGLLYPTAGTARVLGYVPWQAGDAFRRRITLVMGQKSQLVWDLPARDSFRINQAIYDIPEDAYRQRLAELVDLLDIGAVVDKPVRQLSLGERMKCELAAALLHRPDLMFLDEPTLGLDVAAQEAVRGFIREYNRRHGATILLTSHYMGDVTALCRRVIIISGGRILYDGDLAGLAERLAPVKRVSLHLAAPVTAHELDALGRVVDRDGARVTLEVPRDQAPAVAAAALARLPVQDLTVEDPPIAEVIARAFAGGGALVGSAAGGEARG